MAKNQLLSICVLCFASHVFGVHGIDDQESNSSGLGCLSCLGEQSELVEMLESHKIAQRLEYVKQQLISNVHIQTPSINPPKLNSLPDFLVEQLVNSEQLTNEEDMTDLVSGHKTSDTRQVVFFPEEETLDCHAQTKSSICLTFKLDEGVLSNELISAVIWLRQNQYYQTSNVQNFTIVDKNTFNVKNRIRRVKINEARQQNGWYQIEITGNFKSWQLHKDTKKHTLVISCDTCQQPSFVSNEWNDTKSFLLIRIEKEKNSRSKRGVDCVPGNQECCRDSLDIDFKSLGNFKMIVQPEKVNLYKCRGSCYYHSAVDAGIPYASLRAMLKLNSTPNMLLPTTCCAPTKFSGLSVIYAKTESEYEQTTIPNMVVESCGCV